MSFIYGYIKFIDFFKLGFKLLLTGQVKAALSNLCFDFLSNFSKKKDINVYLIYFPRC